jgi:hypothetical protein
MLDAQKLPSQTLEALLAFWQQHAGTHCRAGAPWLLKIGPAISFEWRAELPQSCTVRFRIDGCSLQHECNQKDALSVPKNHGEIIAFHVHFKHSQKLFE